MNILLVYKRKVLSVIVCVCSEVRDLIAQCLSYQAVDRPSLEEILAHPWLTIPTKSSASASVWPHEISRLIKEYWTDRNYFDRSPLLQQFSIQVCMDLDSSKDMTSWVLHLLSLSISCSREHIHARCGTSQGYQSPPEANVLSLYVSLCKVL